MEAESIERDFNNFNDNNSLLGCHRQDNITDDKHLHLYGEVVCVRVRVCVCYSILY